MRTAHDSRPLRADRGTVLVVTLIFAAIIAISLSSFLRLSVNASKLAYRSHFAGVAMNAAEAGLERAMWAINKKNAGSTTAWNGWDTTSGSTARRTFDLGSVSGGGSVSVKVLVSDRELSSNSPYAVARAIVTPKSGDVIEKWIKISLKQRKLFSNGLVAKDRISFSGNNAAADSYNSANGDYNTSTNRNPNSSAGSASVDIGDFNLGNADIFGYVSVGTNDYSGLSVGPNGKVTGDFSAPNGTVDYSRVATNFTANFPAISAPSQTATSLGAVSSDKTLPVNAASDSKVTDADGTVTYYYTADSVNLNGGTLKVSPGYNVVLTVAGNVSVSGNGGSIKVDSTKNSAGTLTASTLNLYVAGNLSVSGQGVVTNVVTTTTTTTTTTTEKVKGVMTTVTSTSTSTSESAGRPQYLMIWGTGDTTQSITVSGNGSLSAVVYAPNAAISAKGGGNSGSIYGAFIGNTITMTGNDAFHFDESLKELDNGEALGIDKWDEFVSVADRSTYGSIMNF